VVRIQPGEEQVHVLTGAAVCVTDRLFFRWPKAAENMPPFLSADADTDAVMGCASTAL
jgi:hypothetical protein